MENLIPLILLGDKIYYNTNFETLIIMDLHNKLNPHLNKFQIFMLLAYRIILPTMFI